MAMVHIDVIRANARKKAASEGITPEEAEKLIVDSYARSSIRVDYSTPPATDPSDLDFTGSFNFGANTKAPGTPTSKP